MRRGVEERVPAARDRVGWGRAGIASGFGGRWGSGGRSLSLPIAVEALTTNVCGRKYWSALGGHQ